MKKYITFWQVVLFFLWALFLVLARIMETLPKYDQLFFVVKHASYYLMYTLAIVIIVSMFYRRLKLIILKHQISIHYLNIFTVVILLISFITLYNVRTSYIETRETPLLHGCTYYDKFSNVIYQTRLYGVCPELEVIEETENTIHLRSVLSFLGGTQRFSTKDTLLIDNEQVDVTITETVDIYITYQEERLTYYKQQLTNSYILHKYDDYYEYQSYSFELFNTYNENSFISDQYSNYYDESNLKLFDGFYEHHEFESEPFHDQYRLDVTGENRCKASYTFELLQYDSELDSIVRETDESSSIEFSKVGNITTFVFEDETFFYYDRVIDIDADTAFLSLHPSNEDYEYNITYEKIDNIYLLTNYNENFASYDEYYYDYYTSRISGELMASSSFKGFQHYRITPVSFGTKIEYYHDDTSISTSGRIIKNQQLDEFAYSPKLDYFDYYHIPSGHFNALDERIILEYNPFYMEEGYYSED